MAQVKLVQLVPIAGMRPANAWQKLLKPGWGGCTSTRACWHQSQLAYFARAWYRLTAVQPPSLARGSAQGPGAGAATLALQYKSACRQQLLPRVALRAKCHVHLVSPLVYLS